MMPSPRKYQGGPGSRRRTARPKCDAWRARPRPENAGVTVVRRDWRRPQDARVAVVRRAWRRPEDAGVAVVGRARRPGGECAPGVDIVMRRQGHDRRRNADKGHRRDGEQRSQTGEALVFGWKRHLSEHAAGGLRHSHSAVTAGARPDGAGTKDSDRRAGYSRGTCTPLPTSAPSLTSTWTPST